MGEPSAICIVPARLGSTRLPGKVLLSETGHPLLWHVVETARRAVCVGDVVVACDDESIGAAIEAYGVRWVLTRGDHPNGTSRIAEACDVLGIDDDAIIVNVQGDEPELAPGVIDEAVKVLASSGAPVATAAHPIVNVDVFENPNIVKVARRVDGSALYFSRAPIPHARGHGTGFTSALHHIGMYVYRRSFLREYVGLAPTPLEEAERLEQLRILEHGFEIAVALIPVASGEELQTHGHLLSMGGIDTAEQYAAFVERWRMGGAGQAYSS